MKSHGVTATLATECPSGFNNTKHNCNKRPSRQTKHYCGSYTLVGALNGRYQHYRFRCKSYGCDSCGPKKIRQVRKRIVEHALRHGLHRFLTLTLDPRKLHPWWTTQEKIAFLSEVWRKMRVTIQRKLGKPLVFISVVELQGNGNPHMHLLVDSYLPKQWISSAWVGLGGGWATRIGSVKVHRVAAYMSKYLTDDSLRDLPPGTRRFSSSRGLAIFERKKTNGVWILVRAPIERMRSSATGVTVEQFDADGSLTAFVAASCFLDASTFPIRAPSRNFVY